MTHNNKSKWEELKATIKEKWNKITDEDIEYINGDTEKLNEKFTERYGKSYDEIERDNMYHN
ncbi:CsbD family protein [Senegalia sp. (in: firmicutes)]|uniref:CsbD family protein n=1 Tax=Senegalia sp. (in: firmicutes) TaxID=1924098 RepID=UPI003F943FE7